MSINKCDIFPHFNKTSRRRSEMLPACWFLCSNWAIAENDPYLYNRFVLFPLAWSNQRKDDARRNYWTCRHLQLAHRFGRYFCESHSYRLQFFDRDSVRFIWIMEQILHAADHTDNRHARLIPVKCIWYDFILVKLILSLKPLSNWYKRCDGFFQIVICDSSFRKCIKLWFWYIEQPGLDLTCFIQIIIFIKSSLFSYMLYRNIDYDIIPDFLLKGFL